VLRAFLLTVGVATFVALPLIAILNADKVVKPDKPIIHKHPLFNPNVQRDLNFPTYAQCSAFFFAVYLIAVGTAINVAPGRMPVACLEAFIPTDVITALHMLWSLRKDKTTYEYPSWKTKH